MKTDYSFNRNQLMSLCAVILLVPMLRLFPYSSTVAAGSAAWLSAPAAIPLLLAYLYFICRFMSARKEGEGLAELTLRCCGKKLGSIMLLLMCAWLLLYGGFMLRSGADRIITTIYPHSSPPLFTICMGLVAFLAALGSARSLVRIAKMVLPLVLGVLLLILIFALFYIEPSNLLPVTVQDTLPIFIGSIAAVDIVSVAVYLACFLGGFTPKEPKRFRDYSICVLVILGLMLLLDVAIIGNLGASLLTKLTRPFFSLVRNLVFFGSLERVEALVVALWMLPDFLLVSLLMYTAQHCMRLAFGADGSYHGQGLFDMSDKRWLIPVCSTITIVCGIFIGPDPISLELWSKDIIPLSNLTFAFIIVPSAFVAGKIRKVI